MDGWFRILFFVGENQIVLVTMVNSVRTGVSKGMRRLNVRPTIALIAGDKEPAKALPINCGNVYHLEICYVGQATVVVALGAGVFT